MGHSSPLWLLALKFPHLAEAEPHGFDGRQVSEWAGQSRFILISMAISQKRL
jgi:hypothetical protein